MLDLSLFSNVQLNASAEWEYPQDRAYNHVDMMKRQIEFKVKEKNNDVTSAKWTSVIAGTYGKKNETFQLSRYLTFLTLTFHSNKTKSYLGKVTFTKMNRKQ